MVWAWMLWSTVCSGNTNVRNGGMVYKPLAPTCTSVEPENIVISYLYLHRYPKKTLKPILETQTITHAHTHTQESQQLRHHECSPDGEGGGPGVMILIYIHIYIAIRVVMTIIVRVIATVIVVNRHP